MPIVKGGNGTIQVQLASVWTLCPFVAGRIGALNDDVSYTISVKHGTSATTAQPYLAPAVATVDLRAHIDAEVAKLIRGAL